MRKPLGTKRSDIYSRMLAESIILQSIEDLWNSTARNESISFFGKREFSICANIAGMDIAVQIKLLDMVNNALVKTQNL